MSRPRNLALAVAVGTAVMAAALLLPRMRREFAGEGGSPVAGIDDDQRARDLEAERQRVVHQEQVYQGVLKELVHQRLTLAEAADALRVRLESQKVSEQLLAHFPAATPEESYRRAVIDHVGRFLQGDPFQTEVVRRLEGELAEQLARQVQPTNSPRSPMAELPAAADADHPG